MNPKKSSKPTAILSAAFIGLLVVAGCATSPITHGIPNLARVEDGVWRGGQPNAEGWAWLKQQGIRYDLKLNTESEGSDSQAKENGIQVIPIPIDWIEQTFGEPDPDKIYHAALAIEFCRMDDTKIFVHCQHGQDRTGLVVGAYRVKFEHWSKADAFSEMRTHGFHPLLRGLCWAWDDMK